MTEPDRKASLWDELKRRNVYRIFIASELHVAARTSSFQFRDYDGDIAFIARRLHVATILEGSVQWSGDQIRVTAQLIDASSGYHLWSGNFDREFVDVFAIQDEIAGEVVTALKVSLLGEEQARLQKRPTSDIEVYAEYLINEGRNEEALDVLKTAFVLDPLSSELLRYSIYAVSGLERNDEWLRLAMRVQEFSPESPFGYYQAAFAEHARGNWAQAIIGWLSHAASTPKIRNCRW